MRLGPLSVEDLLLGAANLVAPALLGSGISLDAPPDAGLGLLMLVALAGAVAGIGLRPTRQPPVRAGQVEAPRWGLVGPLMGGLFIVGSMAGEQLGLADGSPVGVAALVLAGTAAAVNHRLPEAGPGIRRSLVAPFVIVCTGLFIGFAGGILDGIDVGAMIPDAPAVGVSFAVFVAILLVGGVGTFYAMFVVAPRELADPQERGWVWVPRFALFVTTALLGIGSTLL